jgi:hypothetical protein
MSVSTIYQQIDSSSESSAELTYFFMMNSLLYSRMESGFPSNNEYYDEDVNIYLANLLTSMIFSEYHANISRYVTPYDIGLFESINSSADPREKYQAYKINADYLLISLGIFDNPGGRRPNSAPHLNISKESYAGRGKTYYRLAQSYSIETARKSTAVTDVLGKLSHGFDKYVKILSLMRGEYFNFYSKISDGELYHLENSVKKIDDKKRLEALYDKFLDAYSLYRQDPSPEARSQVEEHAAAIREIDPGFDFSI